jgi:WNK lysine deficient protein kinase
MNEKNLEEARNIPFDNMVLDAEELIARSEKGLPMYDVVQSKILQDELKGISRYKKLPILLGEGGFKKVYKAVDQIEGKEVAWNEIKISENEFDSKEKSSFGREIALLKRIDHPSILTILDYWFTKDNFVFITEIMSGGTLREYIGKIGEVNIKIIKKWAKQILEGINYLHTQDPPVIHRDIKCENIFVDSSNGEVKIGDLGVAKERRLKRYTVVGTPQFMAREMFEGDGYNEKVDIYAFGMCLIEMATGCYPYKECDDSTDVYRSILQGVPPAALYNISDPCLKNLILRCLVLEKDRLDARTALSHHFLDATFECQGDCIPKESILVKPLTTPGHDMEISLISFEGDVITFQLFFMCEAKFIKFDYDIKLDTVELVAKEMLEENVVELSKRDVLINMLTRGVERAIERKATETQEAELQLQMDINSIELEISNMKVEEESLIAPNVASDEGFTDFSVANDIPSASEINSQDTSHVNAVSNSNTEELTCRTMVYPNKKYENNVFIEEFANDVAEITRRSIETATNWVKILRSHDIYNTTDLRVLVDEDWDKLGLSVYITRAMKNMLYGLDQHPLKEKQLPDNINIKAYDLNISIGDFLKEVTELSNKKECLSVWENKLLAQDIRTVEELKSLHQEDWDRLGLSIFSYRVLKNIIFRKGKIV